MKKVSVLAAALFGMMLFHSCDEDLLRITEEFDFVLEFPISNAELNFEQTADFNLAEYASIIEDYSEQIVDMELETVELWITEIQGLDDMEGLEDYEMNLGTIYVSEPGAENWILVSELGMHTLPGLLDNPTALELNQEGADLLGDLAEFPPYSFSLKYVVDFEETFYELYFTVVLRFGYKMIASL